MISQGRGKGGQIDKGIEQSHGIGDWIIELLLLAGYFGWIIEIDQSFRERKYWENKYSPLLVSCHGMCYDKSLQQGIDWKITMCLSCNRMKQKKHFHDIRPWGIHRITGEPVLWKKSRQRLWSNLITTTIIEFMIYGCFIPWIFWHRSAWGPERPGKAWKVPDAPVSPVSLLLLVTQRASLI